MIFGAFDYGSKEYGGLSGSFVTGLHLYIDGIDYLGYLAPSSLTISDELNQRHVMGFKLVVHANNFRPSVGQQVILIRDEIRLFAGTIDSVNEELTFGSDNPTLFLDVQCVDFNQIADRHLAVKNYETPDQTLRDIVIDLVNSFMVGEGITTDDVQTGPTIAKAIFNYTPVSEALNELSELTGFAWWIDYNKQLHFVDRSTYKAPFSLTDLSQPIRRVKVMRTRDQYRNKQYLRAGVDISSAQVEKFAGDGKTRTFTLGLPVAAAPSIKVNSVSVAAADIGIRSVDTGKKYYWAKNDKQITQDSSQTVLTSSDELEVTYQGFFPIIVLGEDATEQTERKNIEGGSGIYEAVETDEKIDDRDLAMDKLIGLLRRNGEIPTIIEFETDEDGLYSGQLIGINLTKENINGDFLIDSVRMTDVSNTLKRYSVRALSGEHLGGWVDFFKRLSKIRPNVIRDNEVLLLLNTFPETVQLDDAFSTAAALDDGSNDYYTGAQVDDLGDDVEFGSLVGRCNVAKARFW